MDRFEAWLQEQGIGIVGQFATGSDDMLRFRLRTLDGAEFDLALHGELLLERPEEAIQQVRDIIEQHQREREGHGGNGRS